MPSMTDEILRAVNSELNQSRVWIDQMPTVRSIVIDVKFNQSTGLPRLVILRTESER